MQWGEAAQVRLSTAAAHLASLRDAALETLASDGEQTATDVAGVAAALADKRARLSEYTPHPSPCTRMYEMARKGLHPKHCTRMYEI